VTLVGQPPIRLTLFLASQAAHHAGYERPSDLLESVDAFLPAMNGAGQVLLLQRDAVMVLTVPVAAETGGEGDPDGGVNPAGGVDPSGGADPAVGGPTDTPASPARRAAVRMTLENGRVLEGTVEYLMPEGHDRLQDFLNAAGRFLTLRQGDTVHLVHKLRIASVAAI
jgi:hypothetical protein